MKKMIILLVIFSLVIVGCTKQSCEEFKINVTAYLEQDWQESTRIIDSTFCCNLNGHCDNCLTEKGSLWLWGLIENTTGAVVDVEYLGCVKS